MGNNVTHEKLVQYYEEYIDNTSQGRANAELNRDFYDSKQLTAAEESTLKGRGQSPSINNRIKPKVDALLGVERKTRTDPKAQPRTQQHEQEAEAITDGLRYVVENTDFDQVKSQVNENILIEGVGGCTVDVKPKGNKFEVDVNEIPWDRIFYDVHSIKRHFEDAKYKGISMWMDFDDALMLAPGKRQILEDAVNGNENEDDTFADKPKFKWADSNRKRVRINLIYFLDKKRWHYAYYTKSGLLSQIKESPYLDEDGLPQCPIELVSVFVDRDGVRYSSVSQLISIQREINKRHSKALHLLSVRQTFGMEGAVEDIQKMKRELAKPDGHVTTIPGMEFGKHFGVIPTGDMAAAQFEMLNLAKQDIDSVGANPELSGDSNATSGRDFIARQEAGLAEMGVVFDSLRAWEIKVYRQIWNRIKQYWTEERWIRVTDDPENTKWVGLNQKVTLRDELMEEFGEIEESYQNDPRLDTERIKNNVAELDVDIIMEEAPSISTIQQEQFELVTKLYQAAPGEVPLDAVIALSSLRNKKQFMEKIKGDEQQQAEQSAKIQEAEELKRTELMSEIENTDADTDKKKAETTKTLVEAMATPDQTAAG
ncbi:hypothetical protein KAR91_12865 [Candidatus Pacearchaeota archaeon]|nr:hypothetical protein [Candidatus Pacearchaeota archaeon]